jgi:hypothetical protein
MAAPVSGSSGRLFVFCPPPLGKPDRRQERPPINEEDCRSRVRQSAQKGLDCWWYAFNRIRYRFNAPGNEKLPERIVERAGSDRRKTLAKIHLVSLFLEDDWADRLKAVTRQSLESLEAREDLSENRVFCFRREPVSLRPYVDEYISSIGKDNFYDFLKNLLRKKSHQANDQFFKAVGSSSSEAFAKWVQTDPCVANLRNIKRRSDLPPDEALAFMNGLVQLEFAKRIHLLPSQWTPLLPFKALCEELQRHGPLCVSGLFGKSVYKTPPHEVRRINKLPVYAWSPKDPPLPTKNAHAVVLVGAEKVDGQEIVYFTDPNDSSGPEGQKIYAMSYRRLTSPQFIGAHGGFKMPFIHPGYIYAFRNAALNEI